MNKNIRSLVCIAVIATTTALNANAQHRCGTDEAMQEAFQRDPQAKARYEAFHKEAMTWQYNASREIQAYNYDTVPVVFHVLHEYGSENLSDQAIMDALAQVNADYQKKDADTSDIRPVFKSLAEATNIVFALAKKDINGNCINGIVRHYDPVRTHWDRTGTYANLYVYSTNSDYPTSKYLNIYLVKEIQTGTTGGGTVVGYTFMPGSYDGTAYDAIVYNSGFLAGKDSRSLAHEMGHWLGLPHTFHDPNNPNSAGTTCGDDDISDTPPTKGEFSTCPSIGATDCGNTIEANYQNIMDYSSCPKNFTQGQAAVMRGTLTTGGGTGRTTLVSNANMITTGLWNSGNSSCVPTPDFSRKYKTICTGNTITFSDLSYGGDVTTRTWTFEGGMPSSSSDSSVVVTYENAGIFDVTLETGNANGSNSTQNLDRVFIYENTSGGLATAYSQNFSSSATAASEIDILNPSEDNIKWAHSTTGNGNSGSYKINNLSNSAGNIDEFILPAVNLLGVTNITMKFDVAYRMKNNTTTDATPDSKDQLRVMLSTNCGQTWNPRYSKKGSTLATVTTVSSSSFTPTSTQWRTETVTIPATYAKENITMKFEFTAEYGNNIYVDNILFAYTGFVGLEDLALSTGMNIAPNPFSNSSKVVFEMPISSKNTSIKVYDVLGKEVTTLHSGYLEQGHVEFDITRNQLKSSGIYFVTLNVDGYTLTRKVVLD